MRVPHADFGPVVIPADHADVHDERFLYLSDILPTAWQGVVYADVPEGGTLAVLGAGPVGQLAIASAHQQGIERVIVVDLVPERLARARARGAETIDLDAVDSVPDALRELTGGRGPDSVLEAVGMEAHGNPLAEKVIGARQPAAQAGRPPGHREGGHRPAGRALHRLRRPSAAAAPSPSAACTAAPPTRCR